jgi:hypothetical protein
MNEKTKKFLLYVVLPVIVINILLMVILSGKKDSNDNLAKAQKEDSTIENVLPIPVDTSKKDEKVTDIYKDKNNKAFVCV